MDAEAIIIFLFAAILSYIPLWLQIGLFLSSLGKAKKPIAVIRDEKIHKLLLAKTNINIEYTKISESDLPFGMMIGIPWRPQLILSKVLYKKFSPSEIEYVILHEAGHYILAHPIKELLAGISLFICGVFLLRAAGGPIGVALSIVIGLVFGIFMIQLGRSNEIEADTFALTKISNPVGMISATKKFQKEYRNHTDRALVRLLFYRGNPYENRITMANKEIKRRRV